MNEVEELATRVAALPGDRVMVAVTGAPASGKSWLAAALAERVADAAAVAMDGFHLDDRVLRARGLLARKGAPETFDLGGLARALAALRAGGEVVLPVFDRAREVAIAGACVVPATVRVVVVEGNWLRLDRPGWRKLGPWDLTVRWEVPEAVLRARLKARWAGLPMAARVAKIDGNDLPNARLEAAERLPADVVLRGG